MITFIFYLMSDSLIIPLIVIFLPCREKAHDSNEFCRENQKPRRESRIMICYKSNTVSMFRNFHYVHSLVLGRVQQKVPRCDNITLLPNTRTTMSFPFYYI